MVLKSDDTTYGVQDGSYVAQIMRVYRIIDSKNKKILAWRRRTNNMQYMQYMQYPETEDEIRQNLKAITLLKAIKVLLNTFSGKNLLKAIKAVLRLYSSGSSKVKIRFMHLFSIS